MSYGLNIHNIDSHIASCEAHGFANCFKAYAENCAGEYIMEIGFNPNSGYTYIALDNGISICSMLGREVEYLTISFMDGEENFFASYQEAVEYFNS
jgi:hypothetical protein